MATLRPPYILCQKKKKKTLHPCLPFEDTHFVAGQDRPVNLSSSGLWTFAPDAFPELDPPKYPYPNPILFVKPGSWSGTISSKTATGLVETQTTFRKVKTRGKQALELTRKPNKDGK